MGKKLEQARIKIDKSDHEWNFTLAAALMEFRTVKLPKTAGTEDAGDNAEEVEGLILERTYLFEELIKIVNQLFKQFLEIRVGDRWHAELEKVRNWVKQDVVGFA